MDNKQQLSDLIRLHYKRDEDKFKTATLSIAAQIAKDGDKKLAEDISSLTRPKKLIKFKHKIPNLSSNKDIKKLKNLLSDRLNYVALIKDDSVQENNTEKFFAIYAPDFEEIIYNKDGSLGTIKQKYKNKDIYIKYIDIRYFCKSISFKNEDKVDQLEILKASFSKNYVINPRYYESFQQLINKREDIACIDQQQLFLNFLEKFETESEQAIRYSTDNSKFIPYIFDGVLMKYFLKDYKSFEDSFKLAEEYCESIDFKDRSEYVILLESLLGDLELVKKYETDYIKRGFTIEKVEEILKEIMKKALIVEF